MNMIYALRLPAADRENALSLSCFINRDDSDVSIERRWELTRARVCIPGQALAYRPLLLLEIARYLSLHLTSYVHATVHT